jgi:polyhydroxybutyrate depolymerase
VRRLVGLLLLGAFSASCVGGPTASDTPAGRATPTATAAGTSPTLGAATPTPGGASPGADAHASFPAGDFTAGGDRPAIVRVPTGPDPRGAPLVVALHGFTSNAAEIERYFDLGDAAEARGVVVAYPEGSRNPQGDRYWNATDSCCGFGSDAADSAYLAGLIEEVAARPRSIRDACMSSAIPTAAS